MHHDYYFMWCFNPVFYSKFIWKKGERMFWCFDISCRKLSMFECVQKISWRKKKIIIIDIVEYKILWMHASLMHGFRMDGGRTVRDPLPNFPASATIKILLAPGKNVWSARGYFLVFITQVAWRFMAYTRDLIKRNHPI